MLHDAHCPGEAAACQRHPAVMTGDGKPALPFLSPPLPAGATLEAPAARYEIHLLVIPLAGAAAAPGRAVRDWCARVLVHPADRHVDALFRLNAGGRDPQEA